MFTSQTLVFLLLAIISCYGADTESACQHRKDEDVPKLIYSQLKCTPKQHEDNCFEAYECPHASRPKDTCFFKGKTFQIDERIDDADLTDVWAYGCTCSKSLEFNCPPLSDGCAESWVGGYPKFGCYLRWQLNSYCAAGEICPPFEGNAECKVEDAIYKEGQQFLHPTEKCTHCVCNKGFKLEPPFCQTFNCTATMLENSKKIDEFCAPYYSFGKESCCPNAWICPKETDVHVSNIQSSPSTFKCKFGNKELLPGDSLHQKDTELGEINCQCLTPPYLYCTNGTIVH